jgi:hypothetical protein
VYVCTDTYIIYHIYIYRNKLNDLKARAVDMDLPLSALDNLIDKLGGTSKVSEMTGRKGRIVRDFKRNTISYEVRGDEKDRDMVNIHECRDFMKGNKLVAIISDAASTGISLHSSISCGNTRRRVHMTLELPFSADKAVQQMGRSHRSHQVSGPIYKLIVSNLGGEMKFAAAVSQRLQSLGALTKGDRRAAAGQDLDAFNVDTRYGRESLKMLLDTIQNGKGVLAGVNRAVLMTELREDLAKTYLPAANYTGVLREY